MFLDRLVPKNNVHIIARERGKKVPSLCREGHNVWVDLGSRYLAEVISPASSSFDAHYNDSPVRVVRYMGLGIGGNRQQLDIAFTYPTLDAHYPGQNTFDDDNSSIQYLERPIKVTGTPGAAGTSGVWFKNVAAPPEFGPTKATFTCLFENTDLHLGGVYPSVPLSEIALVLSSQTASCLWDVVYTTTPPDYINTVSRQRLVAYNTFDTIAKTPSVYLEVHWEIEF